LQPARESALANLRRLRLRTEGRRQVLALRWVRNASYDASRNAFCDPGCRLPLAAITRVLPWTSICSLLRNCFAIVPGAVPLEFTAPIANAPANDRSIGEHVRALNNAIISRPKRSPIRGILGWETRALK